MATSTVDQKWRGARGPILVVAAMERELARLRRMVVPNLELISTGEGRVNAARGLGSRLGQSPAGAVVAIGFAGALSPVLRVGEIVVASRVLDFKGNVNSESDPALLGAATRVKIEGVAVHFGAAVTVDEIICKADAKRRLASALGENEVGCVDMESSAVAEVCDGRGIPFLIARAITDLLDEDLPIDFNLCLDSGGRLSDWKVARSALARPRAIRGLWELKRRSDMCASALAEFVARLAVSID